MVHLLHRLYGVDAPAYSIATGPSILKQAVRLSAGVQIGSTQHRANGKFTTTTLSYHCVDVELPDRITTISNRELS